jgi:hypothetical protein
MNHSDVNKTMDELAGGAWSLPYEALYRRADEPLNDERDATQQWPDEAGGFDMFDDEPREPIRHTQQRSEHEAMALGGGGGDHDAPIVDPWRQLDAHAPGEQRERAYRAGRTWRSVASQRRQQRSSRLAAEARAAVSLPLFVGTLPEFALPHRRAAAQRRRRRAQDKKAAAAGLRRERLAEPFASPADDAYAHDGGFDAHDDIDNEHYADVDHAAAAAGNDDERDNGAAAFRELALLDADADDAAARVERVLFEGLDDIDLVAVPLQSYESLCKQHVEQYVTMCNKFIKHTDLSRRIAHWTARYNHNSCCCCCCCCVFLTHMCATRIEPMLEEQVAHGEFDILDAASGLLETLASSGVAPSDDQKHASAMPTRVSFGELCGGAEQWQVCRRFVASLQLVNHGNVRLYAQREHDDDDVDSLEFSLLSLDKRVDTDVEPAPQQTLTSAAVEETEKDMDDADNDNDDDDDDDNNDDDDDDIDKLVDNAVIIGKTPSKPDRIENVATAAEEAEDHMTTTSTAAVDTTPLHSKRRQPTTISMAGDSPLRKAVRRAGGLATRALNTPPTTASKTSRRAPLATSFDIENA